jgi:hypothetical protein
MFILFGLFAGLAVIFGWLCLMFMTVLLFLPQIIDGIFILASLIVIFVFGLVCAWLAFIAVSAFLRWVLRIVSGLIGWISGRREKKVEVKSPRGVMFEARCAKDRQDGEKFEGIHTSLQK